MASLTDNLPNANASRRIIDPQNKGPSFLSGLARAADNVISTGSRLFEQNEQDNARASAEAERQQTIRINDRVAGTVFDHGLGTGRFAPQRLVPEPTISPTGPVPLSDELEGAPLPPGVTRGVERVVRARSAEEQGRMTSGSTQIILEQEINAIRAENPDREDLVYKAFKDAGFEHYLFRDRDLQTTEENFAMETARQGERTFAEAAFRNGLVEPGTSPAEAARVGKDWLAVEEAARVSARSVAAQRAATGDAVAAADRDRAEAGREMNRTVSRLASSTMGPLFNRWQSLALEAQTSGSDTAFNQATSEFQASITLIGRNLKAAAEAQGTDPEATAQIDEYVTRLRTDMAAFLEGPASAFAGNKRALENAQTVLNLDIAQSLPVYNGLKAIFGQATVNELFAPGGLKLPPAVMAELRGEASRISGAIDSEAEELTLASIARLLRGQTGINRLSETAARQVMPVLMTAARNEQTAIASGSPTANRDVYMNANLQGYGATLSLQPGRGGDVESRSRGTAAASASLFSNTATAAAVRFADSDPVNGQTFIQAGRAAATHLFKVAQGTRLSPQETLGGLWSFEYVERPVPGQPATAIYRPVLNREAYERQVRGAVVGGVSTDIYNPQIPVALPSFEEALRTPPPAVLDHVQTLNNTMNYLVQTQKFDEDFRGVSPRQTRDMLANGTVPPAMQTRAESDRSLDTRIQEFRRDTAQAATEQIQYQTEVRATSELKSTVFERAQSLGLSTGLVDRLVRRESSWNPNAENRSTQARGLFQINDDRTDRTLDENINDGLQFVVRAKQDAQRVLGRQPQDWEVYVAHQQGPGGGPALLNPANANRPAVDVLAPLYPNRRIALSAITGNGGRADMTASEFLGAIKNFFEG